MSPFTTFMTSAGGAALIAGAWALIKWLAERRAAKKDSMKESLDDRIAKLERLTEALVASQRSILYTQIKDRAKAALAAGEVSTEELEDITRKHELYHGPLGGNGYLDTLMDKLRELPVRD